MREILRAAPGFTGHLMQFARFGSMLGLGGFAAALLVAGTASASANGLVGARAHVAAVPMPDAPASSNIVSTTPASSKPVAEATRASLDESGEGAKLSFDLSLADKNAKAITPAAFVLANPDRVIVDLPQVDFTVDPQVGKLGAGRRHKKGGLVASYRFGLLAAGRSRIVVDLAAPARIVGASVRIVGRTTKLIVELAKSDRASFQASAKGAEAQKAAVSVVPKLVAAASPGKATIVLDPGHGGPDTGANVNGIIEKDVTLAFAKMLAAKLDATGNFNVVMTRATDVFIPLSERVHVARASEAALMISIHADTLPETADVSGATVYTVSDRASDAYAAKVAAKENDSDASVGVDGQADMADVNDILFDLTRQETRAYSHVFARTLVNYWKVAGRLNKNPQRAAGFVVLKAPDVPSVLLELGYLSSPVDSVALTSDDWREKATGRMAEAIVAYFADRNGPAKAAAGVSMPLARADLPTGPQK